VRVVVADDSLLVRAGVVRLLAEAGFEVAGEAADADELMRLVEHERPDVAIVDIRMPPSHTDEGLRAARQLRQRYPEMGVLVLSQHVSPRYAAELLEGGSEGVGYLLKDRISDVAELADGVRRIHEGGCVLDPGVVAQLVGRPRHGEDPRLFITEHTVEKHVQAIFAKLELPATGDDHRRVLAVLTFLDSG
jgi:DNA-binding NarL/FixJ family response regulator